MFSLGWYVPVWFGLSWAELRRETRDERTSAVAQAFALLVPGYGFLRVRAHFETIDRLAAKAGATTRSDGTAAGLGATIWWLTLTHWSSEPLFLALNLIEIAAGTAVVVYGQRALNAYWRARPGPPVDERVAEVDWIALAGAACFLLLTVLELLATTS